MKFVSIVWVQGMWPGKKEKSDEKIVYVGNRVRKYLTVKRLPEFQRWNPGFAVESAGSSVAP